MECYVVENIKSLINFFGGKTKLSNITGVKYETLKAIEKKDNMPTLYTVIKISKALNITIDQIVYEKMNMEEFYGKKIL